MTVYSVDKECYTGMPYLFRCRVYGKYDYETKAHAPTYLDRDYDDLTDYDGLGYTVSEIADVNATRIGNPTISDDGVLSGLSSTKYLKLESPFDPSSNIWEAKLKVRTGNDVTSDNFILHSCKGLGDSNRFGIRIFVDETHFQFSMSATGTSWGINTGGSYTVLTNTTYWLKVGWNGTQYYLKYSTDGITYTDDIVVSSTSGSCPLAYTYIGIFSGQGMNSPWQGSIDLKECSLKTASQYFPDVWTTVWEGVSTQHTLLDFSNTKLPWKWDYEKKLSTKKYILAAENTTVTCYGNTLNGTINGSVEIDNNKLISGFSSSNYLTAGNNAFATANSWAYVSKFKATTINKYQFFFHRPVAFGLDNSNRMHVWNLPMGDIYSDFTFSADTWYWVKFEFTGTEYNGYYKTTADGEWIRIINVASTSKVTSSTTPTYIGLNPNNTSEAFAGFIDLKEAHIVINGNEAWRAFSKNYLAGCLSGSTDSSGKYYCYAISGDDHVQLVKKTGSVIDTRAVNPRYLGEVSV